MQTSGGKRVAKPLEQPTMRDVAARAGVSIKTVSRVVNNEPHIRVKTREKVDAAIRELGFRPNEIARSLHPGRSSSTIGLLIEDIANPFYSTIARGVEEVAHQHHYMVIIGSNEKNPQQEHELVGALLRRRVEGLLIVPASHDHSYLSTEVKRGIPVIFVDRPPEHLDSDVILLDNRGGTRKGIEYLLHIGHQRIGYIGGDLAVFTGTERLAGYREALAAWNVPLDEALIMSTRHDTSQAERAANELLALPDPPTAIFADNNRMSVGVLRALSARSTAITVMGFDDVELAEMLPFPISLITHDPLVMGRIAANLLFTRLAGDDRSAQRIIIPTKLITHRGIGAINIPSRHVLASG
jgi:LacI family transcriptional regulator